MKHSKLFLASLAEAKQLSTLKEDESSWLKMHNSLSSLMDHLQTPEECNTILEKLKEFMVKTLLSDRSRLSGASINLLNKIISIQKDSFNESIFLNYLFKLVNKPNKVFNQRAEETLMNLNNKLLAKNFTFLKEQYNSVNKNVRRVVIRLLIKVDELLNQEMKMLIEKAKSDNCGEVRKLAKDFSCVSALINSPLKKVVKKEENKINLVKNNQPIEKKIEVKKEVKINDLIFDFPKNDLKKEIIDRLAKKVSVKEKVNIYFDKNKMEEDTYNSNLIESINNFLYKSDSTKFSQNDKNLENSVKEISFSQPQIKFDFLKKEEKQTEIKLLTEKKEELQKTTVNFKESLNPNIFLEKEKKSEEFFLEEQKKEIIKEEEKEIIEETQEIKSEVFTKNENNLENILKEEILETENVIEPEINKEEIILEKVTEENEIIEVKEEINNNEIFNDFSSQKNSNFNSQQETEKTLEIQSNEHLTIINSKEETLISNKLNDNFPEEEKEFYFEKNNLNLQENTLIEEEIFELKEVNQNENNLEIQNKEISLVSDNKSLKKEESLETEKIFSKEIRNISFVSREEEVGELSIILEEKMSVKDKSLIKEEEKNNLEEEENSFIEIANKEEECNLNKNENFLNNEEIKEHEELKQENEKNEEIEEIKREEENEELKKLKEELKELKEEIKEEEIEEQEELKEEQEELKEEQEELKEENEDIKNKSFCEENQEMAYISIIKKSQESLKNKECLFLEKEETSFLIDKNLNNETLTDEGKLLENDTSLHYDSSVNEKILNSFINNINSNNLTVEEDESMIKKEGTFEE